MDFGETSQRLLLRQGKLKPGLHVFIKSSQEELEAGMCDWNRCVITEVTKGGEWCNVLRQGESKPMVSRRLIPGGRWFISSNQSNISHSENMNEELQKIFAASTDENLEPDIENGVQILERYIDQGDVSPPEQSEVITDKNELSFYETTAVVSKTARRVEPESSKKDPIQEYYKLEFVKQSALCNLLKIAQDTIEDHQGIKGIKLLSTIADNMAKCVLEYFQTIDAYNLSFLQPGESTEIIDKIKTRKALEDEIEEQLVQLCQYVRRHNNDTNLIDAVISRMRVLSTKFKEQVHIVLQKAEQVIPDIYDKDSPLINIEYDNNRELLSSTAMTVDFDQNKKRTLTTIKPTYNFSREYSEILKPSHLRNIDNKMYPSLEGIARELEQVTCHAASLQKHIGEITQTSNTYYREPRVEPFDVHLEDINKPEDFYEDMSKGKTDKNLIDNNSQKENLRAINDYRYIIMKRDEEIADLRLQVTNLMTAKHKQRQSESDVKRQMAEQFDHERDLMGQNMEAREQEWKENVNQITANIKSQYNKVINERTENYEKELQKRELLYKGEIDELRKNLKEARKAALYVEQDEDFHEILQQPKSYASKLNKTCPKFLDSDEEITKIHRPKKSKKKLVVRTQISSDSSSSDSSKQRITDDEVELKIQGKEVQSRIQKLKSFIKYDVSSITALEDNQIKELNDRLPNQELHTERLNTAKLKLEKIYLKSTKKCDARLAALTEDTILASDELLLESNSVAESITSEMYQRSLKTYSQNAVVMNSLNWPQFSGTSLPQIYSFESEMNHLLTKTNIPRTDRGNLIRKQIKHPACSIDSELGANPTEKEVFDLLKKHYGSSFHISEIIKSEHLKLGAVPSIANSTWSNIFQIITKHNNLIKETLTLDKHVQESPITGNYIRTLELCLSSSYQQQLSMEYHSSSIDTKFRDLQDLFSLIEKQATNWQLSETNKSGRPLKPIKTKELPVLMTIPPIPPPASTSVPAGLPGYPNFTGASPMMRPPYTPQYRNLEPKPTMYCAYCDTVGKHTKEHCFKQKDTLDHNKPTVKLERDLWSQKRVCFLCDVFNQNPIPRDHLFRGPNGYMVRQACPEITDLDNLTQVHNKLTESKVCLSCLRGIEGQRTHKLGQPCPLRPASDPQRPGIQLPWQCQTTDCPNRVMICKEHKDTNREAGRRFRMGWPTRLKNSFVFITLVKSVEEAARQFRNLTNLSEDSISLLRKQVNPLNLAYCEKQLEKLLCEQNLPHMYKTLENLFDSVKQPITKSSTGLPHFLFHSIKGKNGQPINVIFDSGASFTIFQENIFGTQLAAVPYDIPGRTTVQGVSGTDIKVSNFISLLPMQNSENLQLICCQGIPQLIHVPTIDIRLAEEILMKNYGHMLPEDFFLTNYSNETSTIKVDGLVGISNIDLFPELILETNLGFNVYRSKIQCNEGYSPYCLGGVIPTPDDDGFENIDMCYNNEEMLLNHAGILINQRNLKLNFKSKYFVDHENEVYYDSDKDDFYLKEITSEHCNTESEESTTKFEHLCKTCLCNKESGPLEEQVIRYGNSNIPTTPPSLHELKEGLGAPLSELGDAIFITKDKNENTTNKCNLLSNIKPNAREKTVKDDFYTTFLDNELQSFKCAKCTNCSTCKELLNSDSKSLVDQVENEIIKANVQIDPEHFRIVVRHPVPENYKELLAPNKKQVEKRSRLQFKKLATMQQKNVDQVKESMNKLVSRGYVVPYDSMTKEEKEVIDKHPLEYYIPTSIVFKGNSISTPSRVCLDASAKTTTGFALNDILPKGNISMKISKMLQRWRLFPIGISGDISKFYNCFYLDPEQWHLQKLRWNFDLDPEGLFQTLIVKSVIYGLKNSAYSCEVGLKKIADIYPEVTDIVEGARYVDDIAVSYEDLETAERKIKSTLEIFSKFGVNFKGNSFAISGQQPPAELIGDEGTISVAACTWNVIEDTFKIQVPTIFLGKKVRGTIVGLKVFEGENLSDLQSFFPNDFCLKQQLSITAAFYDPGHGILNPLLAPLRDIMRLNTQLSKRESKTINWKFVIPNDMKGLFCEKLWNALQIGKLVYPRCQIRGKIRESKGELMVFADSASYETVLIYILFPIKDERYSVSLVTSRSYLIKPGTTVPKSELSACSLAAAVTTEIYSNLKQYITKSTLFTDSEVVLKWLFNPYLILKPYHRNRVSTILERFGSEVYHVKSKQNPADIFSRDQVKAQSLGPDSTFFNGPTWLGENLNMAIDKGFITKASNLSQLEGNQRQDFLEGITMSLARDKNQNIIREAILRSNELETKRQMEFHKDCSEDLEVENNEECLEESDKLQKLQLNELEVPRTLLQEYKCLAIKAGSDNFSSESPNESTNHDYFNFFIQLPVSEKGTVEALKILQDAMINLNPTLANHLVKPDRFHVTLTLGSKAETSNNFELLAIRIQQILKEDSNNKFEHQLVGDRIEQFSDQGRCIYINATPSLSVMCLNKQLMGILHELNMEHNDVGPSNGTT